MPHKQKSIREIYTDSISINLTCLRKEMLDKGVSPDEVTLVLEHISKQYNKRLDEIELECNRDAMVLETVPSPLGLLVQCISKIDKSTPTLSPESHTLLRRYSEAWEEWM